MTTSDVFVDSDVTVPVDVYAPNGGGPYPLVILRHGLTQSKENLAGWGKLLASHGYVAVMPDARVSWMDVPEADAKDMLTVMTWAMRDPSLAGSVDPARRVLGGHSFGGLAALVAASQDPSLRALVLLDTEGQDLGASDGASISIPTLGIFGEPNADCNESGTGVTSFEAVTGPRFGLRIKGASHCAAESPPGAECEAQCGTVTEQAQALYQQFVMSFLDAYITCNPTSFASVDPRVQPPDGVEIFSDENRGTPSDFCAATPP
jgi:dienelactone hydrolase